MHGNVWKVRALRAAVLALSPLGLSACFVVHTMSVEPVEPNPGIYDGPVRAQMNDGAIVLFRSGARITADQVVGTGMRFGPTLADSAAVTAVRLSDVTAMRTYRGAVDGGATVVASTMGTALTMFGLGALCAATRCIQIGLY